MSKLYKSEKGRFSNGVKVLESLNWATEFLEQHGIECSRRNSELLLCHLLQCRPAELYLNADTALNSVQIDELIYLLQRRKRLPIQYIVGVTEFMGLEFMVNPSVFIPRPETELLVETVLKTVHRSPFTVHRKKILPRENRRFFGTQSSEFLRNSRGRTTDNGERTTENSYSLNILDIGTGCGNIAISLTKYLTHCKIVATDISKEALSLAKENAQLHQVQDRITFIEGDLFAPLEIENAAGQYLSDMSMRGEQRFLTGFEAFSSKKKKPNFEVIVSNPPYIPSNMLKSLPLEVKCEPEIALNGGKDGLCYYWRIISDSPQYLVKGGYLIMEIGFGQLKKVEEIIKSGGQFRLVEVIKDYQGIERVVVAQKINI